MAAACSEAPSAYDWLAEETWLAADAMPSEPEIHGFDQPVDR